MWPAGSRIQLTPSSLIATLLLMIYAESAASQEIPRIANAKEETRDVSQNLEATVGQIAGESRSPAWIGYSVEEVTHGGSVCCENHYPHGDGGCGVCRLENGGDSASSTGRGEGTLALESAERMVVLLRVAEKRVVRLRFASTNCTLDAGGLRFVWLKDGKAEESVALLKRYVHTKDFAGDGDRGMSDQALMAIALHAGGSADRALAEWVAPDQPEELRKRTSFWLGAARGKSGLAALQSMAKRDSSPDVRAAVTFALSASAEPNAVDEMIRIAHEDQSANVRGQALFWLAQKAEKKASSAITGAIESDPDTEVKKKAVFALSQMPKDEGIPKLIQVAQTNRNPEVRKHAMFWLGESHDPRALAFFEKILAQ
jgi:HEAT repeat protein